MGFFADIMRDSRRGGDAFRTSEAPASLGGEMIPTDAPVASAATLAASAEPMGSVTSVIQFRKEGGGQPRATGRSPVQNAAVTRQVVGLSTSGHIPVTGLPEAMQQGVTPPKPVAREQAGCESDRTVTGDYRVERMESFHDGGSNVAPVGSVGASDSSRGEALSGYAASKTGKVSVETQGRQQAGTSRAGSTTPSVVLAGEKGEEACMQPDVVPVANDSRPISVEAAPHSSAPQNHLPKPLPSVQGTPPEVLPAEVFQASILPEKLPLVGHGPQETLAGAVPTVNPMGPARFMVPAERLRNAPKRDLAVCQGRDDQKGMSTSAPPNRDPQVRIGTIEVVVVAPAPEARPGRNEERSRPDLASRHYLRNF